MQYMLLIYDDEANWGKMPSACSRAYIPPRSSR